MFNIRQSVHPIKMLFLLKSCILYIFFDKGSEIVLNLCNLPGRAFGRRWAGAPLAKAHPGTFIFYLMALMLLTGRDLLTGKPQSGSPCRRNSATDTDPDAAANYILSAFNYCKPKFTLSCNMLQTN